MSKAIPCIFEADPITNEATGTVAPFCSDECRAKAIGTLGFISEKNGVSWINAFSYTPHCEECDAEITE